MSSKKTKNYRSLRCLNCNQPLDISDKFCSNCGQKNTKSRLSLKDFFEEFLSNFYAYDSRIKNTVFTLFTKPGKAAKEFINGRKMFYANPFRFYLSVSIIYFILNSFSTKFEQKFESSYENYKENDSIVYYYKNPKNVDGDSIITNKKVKKTYVFTTEKELNKKGFFKRTYSKMLDFEESYKQNKTKSIDSSLTVLGHSKTKWNSYLFKKVIDGEQIFGNSDKRFKESFYEYIYAKIPFILFISLPFLTLCLYLIYLSANLNYAEHLVFVFNAMTFFFLLLIIDKIINLFIDFNLHSLIAIGYPLYFYKSLRNFYHQSRWKTILKFVILTFTLSIMTLFVTVLIILIMFILY